jgi:hypothetical protein
MFRDRADNDTVVGSSSAALDHPSSGPSVPFATSDSQGSDSSGHSQSKTNIGTIVGAVFAGLGGILVIVAAVFVKKRLSKRTRNRNSRTTIESESPPAYQANYRSPSLLMRHNVPTQSHSSVQRPTGHRIRHDQHIDILREPVRGDEKEHESMPVRAEASDPYLTSFHSTPGDSR